MCLSLPVQIVKINKKMAVVKKSNRNKTIDISLINKLKIKDWVLCANNFAIRKIRPKEAKEILRLLKGGKRHESRT